MVKWPLLVSALIAQRRGLQTGRGLKLVREVINAKQMNRIILLYSPFVMVNAEAGLRSSRDGLEGVMEKVFHSEKDFAELFENRTKCLLNAYGI